MNQGKCSGNPRIFPDSKPHPYIDFMSSQCTVIVYLRLRKMSHTIYVTRIILRLLSALFGLQFMLPMEKSVTFTGACANEIILARLITKQKKEVIANSFVILYGLLRNICICNAIDSGRVKSKTYLIFLS